MSYLDEMNLKMMFGPNYKEEIERMEKLNRAYEHVEEALDLTLIDVREAIRNEFVLTGEIVIDMSKTIKQFEENLIKLNGSKHRISK